MAAALHVSLPIIPTYKQMIYSTKSCSTGSTMHPSINAWSNEHQEAPQWFTAPAHIVRSNMDHDL